MAAKVAAQLSPRVLVPVHTPVFVLRVHPAMAVAQSGSGEGDAVGVSVGAAVGDAVGVSVGAAVVGCTEGECVGASVGGGSAAACPTGRTVRGTGTIRCATPKVIT